MPTPCPGPCNNAWRRAETAHAETGADHHIQPAWGQPAQCWGCTDNTRAQLAALPRLLAEDMQLEALYGTATKMTGTIGRISVASWPGQAAMLFVDAIVSGMEELQADILKLRNVWPADYEPEPVVSNGRKVAGIARVLLAHWDWAMQNHPAADEPWGRDNANPGSQVSGWYRSVLRFTKQDEQRDVQRLAPCPRCEGPYLVESRDLRLVDDRPYIECKDPDCQRVMTSTEYEAYVKTLTGQVKAAA
ncbi:MAG: hypothetical protein HOY79_49430 [Streptomyces sp.]|nr:hypothetical protein [Streptomyces sp.]